MHELKLFGKRPKEKHHSYKGEVGEIANNLIDRNFKADRPLEKWTTDVSEFKFSGVNDTFLQYLICIPMR